MNHIYILLSNCVNIKNIIPLLLDTNKINNKLNSNNMQHQECETSNVDYCIIKSIFCKHCKTKILNNNVIYCFNDKVFCSYSCRKYYFNM